MAFSAKKIIKGKLLVKLAKAAPRPRVTKIIGKAQHKIVVKELNKARNVINLLFISNNFAKIIAIINN